MSVISNDCWVSINLNELAAARASFLGENLTADQLDEVASELRVRMTFDSLFEQADMMVWEIADNQEMLPQYGQIETGVIKEPEFEIVKLTSHCWEIDVPRRIKK